MKIRSYLLKSWIVTLIVAATSVWAQDLRTTPDATQEIKPFSHSEFVRAQKEKKGIVLYVSASWCGHCRNQEPILRTVAQQEMFKDVVFFVLNYDSSREFLRTLGIRAVPAVIIFQGEVEKDRFIGRTDQGKIEELLQKATYKEESLN